MLQPMMSFCLRMMNGKLAAPGRQLRRLRNVSYVDVLLLVRIGYLTCKVLLLQSRRSLPALLASFETGAPARRTSPQRLLRLVDLVMRATFGSDYCMKRSLVLFHFLRGWGYDVRVHFGVFKPGAELKGHAWVELAGEPFGEPADPRATFVRTYSHPPAAGVGA